MIQIKKSNLHGSMISLLNPADLISMINAIFGFMAILTLSLSSLDQHFTIRLSFILILLAILADGLDGVIARKTKKGNLGPYLESMADITSTGIATSFLIFYTYHPLIGKELMFQHFIMIGGLILYLVCNLLRLSAFHPLKSENHFIGLPSPAAAILLLCLAYITIPFIIILLLIIIISLLMISSFYYPKPSISLNSVTLILIFLIIIFDTFYNAIFIWILIGLIILYIIFGPIFKINTNKKMKEIKAKK
jgi:CDP-diacylglycerol--serine O-phosphatidyltransferase